MIECCANVSPKSVPLTFPHKPLSRPKNEHLNNYYSFSFLRIQYSWFHHSSATDWFNACTPFRNVCRQFWLSRKDLRWTITDERNAFVCALSLNIVCIDQIGEFRWVPWRKTIFSFVLLFRRAIYRYIFAIFYVKCYTVCCFFDFLLASIIGYWILTFILPDRMFIGMEYIFYARWKSKVANDTAAAAASS